MKKTFIFLSIFIAGLVCTKTVQAETYISTPWRTCCSHTVKNKSGHFIYEVRFAEYFKQKNEWTTFATRSNLPASGNGWIQNFTTNQAYNGPPRIINCIVVVYGPGAPQEGVNQRTNWGDWSGGNKIFVINPDYSISTE